jgi:hypothetical protein
VFQFGKVACPKTRANAFFKSRGSSWPSVCTLAFMMTKRSGEGTQTETAMASAHLSERREARYPISFAIEVTWLDGNGEIVHEKTSTINVSEWGCAFFSSLALSVDDIISVRRLVSEGGQQVAPKQAFFQVVRAEHKPEGHFLGAWKMDDTDVWGEDLAGLAKPKDSRLESRSPAQSGVAEPD